MNGVPAYRFPGAEPLFPGEPLCPGAEALLPGLATTGSPPVSPPPPPVPPPLPVSPPPPPALAPPPLVPPPPVLGTSEEEAPSPVVILSTETVVRSTSFGAPTGRWRDSTVEPPGAGVFVTRMAGGGWGPSAIRVVSGRPMRDKVPRYKEATEAATTATLRRALLGLSPNIRGVCRASPPATRSSKRTANVNGVGSPRSSSSATIQNLGSMVGSTKITGPPVPSTSWDPCQMKMSPGSGWPFTSKPPRSGAAVPSSLPVASASSARPSL